jgi:glycerol-3-phosphate acyltransferase PlsY
MFNDFFGIGLVAKALQSIEGNAIFIFCYILCVLVSAAASYFLGSVNSAIVISKALYKEDIRNYGSGNAGLTNVLRTYGKKAAALTLIGDMLKTALSVLFAGIIFGFSYTGGISLSPFCYLAGSCAVLGHVFPIYYGFKGGKGVLVTATMALILSPLHFAALIAVFIIIVVITRYVSLGSIVVATLFPITICLYVALALNTSLHVIMTVSVFFLGGFVIWCHRSNIKRLLTGTEKKISIGKKDKKS